MDHMDKRERERIYQAALHKYGFEAQAIVAIEELSELQKEICKTLRGGGSRDAFAEEIADAWIMLEQMQLFMDLKQMTQDQMDRKLIRLQRRLREEVE